MQIPTKSFSLSTIEKGDKNSPKLAITLPGRLDSKDYLNTTSHTQFLADQGYLAVTFDPPGTWESAGTIEDFTTTNYIKAVNELIEYYGNKPTLLVGFSRGGAVAMLASTNPAVEALILVMASYKPPTPPPAEALEIGYKISRRPYPLSSGKEGKKEFRIPLNYWEDGKKHDQVAALKKFQGPKLIIFGTRDEFTEPQEVEKVFAQLDAPKMLREIDCEHDYVNDDEVIEKVEGVMGEFVSNFKDLL